MKNDLRKKFLIRDHTSRGGSQRFGKRPYFYNNNKKWNPSLSRHQRTLNKKQNVLKDTRGEYGKKTE